MEFTGFSPRTLQFLIELQWNNTPEYFAAKRADYDAYVLGPLKALAETLAPHIEAIDTTLERRTTRVVSRIRRDTRYARDKAPYRDHMWINWWPSGHVKQECLALYFDIFPGVWHMGFGMMGNDKPYMDAIRDKIRVRPSALCEAWEACQAWEASHVCETRKGFHFELQGEEYKRIAIPEGIPDKLLPLYRKKGFWFSHAGAIEETFEAGLVARIRDGLMCMEPLYRQLRAVEPVR